MADSVMIWSGDAPQAQPVLKGVPPNYHGLVGRVVGMAQTKGAQILSRAVVGKTVNLAQTKFSPYQLYQLLNEFVEKGFMSTVMIWGEPGIGKSSIVRAIAKEHGIECIDLRLGQLAPTDIRGIPSVTADGLTRWNAPQHYPQGGRGILFLDEFNQAGAALQGIAQQLILDRKVGDYVVPEGWFIWAAGNRKQHGASVHAMPSPVANRMIHLEVVIDLDEWATWAQANLGSPMVLSYVMATRTGKRDDKSPLHIMPTKGEETFPTPRSWELAAKLYEIGCPVAPAVGQDQAEQFKVFVDRMRDIVERLGKNEAVKVPAPDAANVAWLMVSTGSTSKVTIQNGNQAEFDKLVEKIRSTIVEA